MNDDEKFNLITFLEWTGREEAAAEQSAYDAYVELGVATAIAFTCPSTQNGQ